MRAKQKNAQKTARWLWLFPIALSVGLVFFVIYRANPQEQPFLPCLFYQFTGLYCAGCGITRGINALLHGHVLQAFRFNALFFLGAPIAGYFLLAWLLPHRLPLPRREKPWLVAFVVSILVFTILRNLPFAPFSYLAPAILP